VRFLIVTGGKLDTESLQMQGDVGYARLGNQKFQMIPWRLRISKFGDLVMRIRYGIFGASPIICNSFYLSPNSWAREINRILMYTAYIRLLHHMKLIMDGMKSSYLKADPGW
jgi:hypothetical protein